MHKASAGPLDLEQHVQERLFHRLLGSDLEKIFSIQPLRDREFDLGKIGRTLNTRRVEIRARREACVQALEFFFRDGGKFNFGVERLVQC